MTTPRFEISKLPNFPYWKVSGGVDYAVREALNALDLSPVANWYDPDTVPEPVLAAILNFYGVGGLDTTIFGPDYRHRLLAANTELRRFRGTVYILDRFGAISGVMYSYTLSRDADTGDATGIVFTITPPVGVTPLANWQAYMRRAFRWLLPPRLVIGDFKVTLTFTEQCYVYCAAKLKHRIN